jgi:hypothetical protein
MVGFLTGARVGIIVGAMKGGGVGEAPSEVRFSFTLLLLESPANANSKPVKRPAITKIRSVTKESTRKSVSNDIQVLRSLVKGTASTGSPDSCGGRPGEALSAMT